MTIGIILAVLLIIIVFIGFLLLRDNYKARSSMDFVDFQAEEISKNSKDYLLVSGQYNGSSLKIRKVESEMQGNIIAVRAYTTLFSENDSSFLHAIELGSSTNKVVFGNDQKIIWERE